MHRDAREIKKEKEKDEDREGKKVDVGMGKQDKRSNVHVIIIALK